jgi:hypothetical protein
MRDLDKGEETFPPFLKAGETDREIDGHRRLDSQPCLMNSVRQQTHDVIPFSPPSVGKGFIKGKKKQDFNFDPKLRTHLLRHHFSREGATVATRAQTSM